MPPTLLCSGGRLAALLPTIAALLWGLPPAVEAVTGVQFHLDKHAKLQLELLGRGGGEGDAESEARSQVAATAAAAAGSSTAADVYVQEAPSISNVTSHFSSSSSSSLSSSWKDVLETPDVHRTSSSSAPAPATKVEEARPNIALTAANTSAVHNASDLGNLSAAGPKPADFFDGFSAGESTYNEALDPAEVQPEAGWNPDVRSPLEGTRAGGEWFHETESDGSQEAWQTYPGLQGIWIQDSKGEWVQQPNRGYNEEHTTMDGNPFSIARGAKGIDASWFDRSVVQSDRFGREPVPSPESPEFYVGWEDRRFNTSFLKCGEPGCIAEANLDLFSTADEKAELCRMSLLLEHHSGSVVWVKANDASVIVDCNPPQSCDSASEKRPVYACLLDLDLQHLVEQTGTLKLEAKLSEDASATCSAEGDLLRLHPVVSCFVEPKAG